MDISKSIPSKGPSQIRHIYTWERFTPSYLHPWCRYAHAHTHRHMKTNTVKSSWDDSYVHAHLYICCIHRWIHTHVHMGGSAFLLVSSLSSSVYSPVHPPDICEWESNAYAIQISNSIQIFIHTHTHTEREREREREKERERNTYTHTHTHTGRERLRKKRWKKVKTSAGCGRIFR